MFNKMAKTYNSGDSLVVTHLTTNPPVRCLSKAERTGSPVFNVLWSYVERIDIGGFYIEKIIKTLMGGRESGPTGDSPLVEQV
jgi:hypothetical protein